MSSVTSGFGHPKKTTLEESLQSSKGFNSHWDVLWGHIKAIHSTHTWSTLLSKCVKMSQPTVYEKDETTKNPPVIGKQESFY